MIRKAARLLASLFLLLAAPAALAVPIEVVFTANDGSASGQFAFEPRQAHNNPGALTSGRLQIGDRVFEAPVLFYEYYPIADSLAVMILANESSGLPPGDFINLTFSNPDGPVLELPTRASLAYNFGGVYDSRMGTVTAVPEPLMAGLFGLGAAGLAWRRRRPAA
jgi:hypothetical protein